MVAIGEHAGMVKSCIYRLNDMIVRFMLVRPSTLANKSPSAVIEWAKRATEEAAKYLEKYYANRSSGRHR